MRTKVCLNLVTYNSALWLPSLFQSLREQTHRDWLLLVIDNNSSDNTLEILKKELANFSNEYRVIENKENKGFAAGHNQVIQLSNSEYFLLLNPDLYLDPDCLEKLVKFMDKNQNMAAVAPRLMRWSTQFPLSLRRGTKGEVSTGFTDIIDALGLKVYRSRRVLESRSGQQWLTTNKPINQSTDNFIEVFGLSGALALFRRSAIQKVLLDGQLFDELYGSYKEDVDLAFRMHSIGLTSYIVLDAVAYHARASGQLADAGNITAAKNKAVQDQKIRYFSYRNHLYTLCKNEYWQNFMLDLPWILWYELRKVGYLFLFDRKTLFGGWKEFLASRENLKKQKAKIKNLRKISWREMRKWWS